MHHFSPQGRARITITSLTACLLSPAFGAVPLVGNLTITQNDTGNSATGVSGALSQSNGPAYVGGTRGDFGLRFDGATPAADVTNGILMVSLRENGRIPATFEVVYGHAWKGEPRQTPEGHAIVRLQRRERR